MPLCGGYSGRTYATTRQLLSTQNYYILQKSQISAYNLSASRPLALGNTVYNSP